MKLALTLALAVVFTAGNILLIAQTQPNLANGITPQGSYDSTSVDEVNLVNGNLTLHIPLPFDYPQRGKLGIKYYLVVNAKTWAAGGDPNTMTGQWNPTSGCGTAPASGPCGQGPVFVSTASFAMNRIWQSVFQDGVGTSYSATGPDGLVTWDGSSHALNAGTTFDTSGYRVVMSGDDGNGVPNTATIIDRNGTQYIGGFFGGDCSTDPGNGLPGSIQTTTCFQHFSLGSVVDANGNILNPTVPIPNVDTNGSPSILAHAAVGSESAGCFASFGTPWVYYFTYPAPNGQSNQIKLCFSPYPQLATSFSQPGVHQFQDVYSGHPFPGGWRPPVYLTNVILPDNTQWSISYDSYGEITSVGTPTGASIQYAWSEGSFPRCNVAGNDITKVSRAVHARTVTDVNSHAFIWNYQWNPQAGDGTLTHTVTDPNGHDTDHVFVDLTASQTSPSCDFREKSTTTYQGTGGTRTPLQQVDTTWLMKNDGGLGVPSDIKTTVFPSQKVSLEHRDYDPSSPTLGLVISKKNYDWDQGSPGALLREEDTVYEWQKDSRYLTANLLDLPASSVVISPIAAANTKASCPVDGLGTLKACMAETDYTYDETAYLTNYETTVGALPTGSHGAAPNPVRGDPTTVSKWLSTGSVISHVNWYDTGMAFVTTDPLGHNTTYSYDLAYKGMLPTKTCNAKNQCVSATYDVNTGLMASFTDANGSYSASGTTQGDPAHTSTYGHDFMSRPTSTVSAADAQGQHPQTTLSYPSATTVQKLASITSAINDSSTSHEDGLGHVSGTEHVTPGGNALVDITYDGLGHVKRTTNPYYTTSDPTYGIIQTSYDGLGRFTSVTEQDGSIRQVAYNVATTIAANGDCTITTDEAGMQRVTCSDALGRLVEVDEPNPGAAATNATGSVTISGSDQATNVSVSITVAGSGFETPALGSGANAYQYHPTGSSWTFGPNSGVDSNNNIVGGSGITGNNSGFTSSNPAAPEGAQVAFLQGGSANYISQSLSGFQAGVSYTVSFQAAQRGNFNTGGQDFDVYLDSTLLATFRPASTNYALLLTPAFTTTAGTHTVKFVGRDSAGGNGNAAFIDAVQVTGAIVIPNPGFEAPALGAGNFQYSPTGGSWTFGGGTGISANGSGFTSGNPGAPQGGQVAFIQFGSDDVFYQSLSGFQAGVTYTVSFFAAQRGNSSNGGQDFDVYLDSTLLGTFRPASTSYSALSTAPFTTTAGTHTLRFLGRDSAGGNNTAFIDAVQITGTVVGIADAGTVTISVNGTPYSTSFGSGDTSTTIASRLATTINAGSYASATASGGTVNLTSKTAGTIGDYSLTASYTWNSSQFTNSSFTTSTSGAALSGAYNAGDIRNNPFVTLYAYDALGNLLSVDQKGTAPSDNTQWRSRTFTYDSLSRVLTSSNPESGIITYTYDADGELLHKTSPAPGQTGSATQTVSYCYDFLHRVTGRGYGAQSCPLATPIVTYVYDSGANAIGYLTSMTDQAGIATYTYDTLGRLATETRPIAGISKSTSYTYNLNGSIKTLTYPSGRIVTYTPDSAGRLVSAVDNNGTNYVNSASYNPDGSLKGLVNGSTPALNLGLQYTPRLQLCRITAFTSGTLPTSCTNSQNIGNIMDRGYDLHAGNGTPGSGSDNGNVFGITNYRDASRSQTFTYDALNRLASGSSSANTGAYSWGENYSVDAWGNLQISPIGTKAHGGNFTLSGNAQNRPTGLAYDAAGNLMSYSSATYLYDQENRLSSTAGMSYTYDGNGERVLKSNTSTGAAVKRYWLMGGKTLAEGDGSSNLTEEFIYFGETRVARIDLPANTVHYYLSDHLGSTSVVISAAGAVEQDSDYSSYGTEFPVISVPNVYKFTGKERDTESNIDYFGARYFSSLFGRFTSADDGADQSPIDPQSWNLYSYVRNNPISNTDPDGHDCVVQTRTDDHTETVTVVPGSCDKVKIGDGQSKTYVPGTVTGVSRGAGGTSIDIAYKPDDGSAQVSVFSASSAPIPDRPGLAYGYNAAGYHTLGVAGATMNDGRTYALWTGASALAAGCVLGCPTGGTALLNAGRLLYYSAAGILPAVPSAIEKLQKLGMSVPEANELIENPSTLRLIDNLNDGNINYVADVGGKLVRVTTDPTGQRIISAGLMQARNIMNGLASGRYSK
jgi:RHS repeat-associated protein